MHTQHLTNHFDTLPIEVLIVLFSHLSPEQVALSATVNKQFKIAIADNLFWEEKFKKHFPHIYEKMSRLSISNWYAEFCKIYEDEYKKLPRRLRRLFSSIKEGDLENIKSILQLSDFDSVDKNDLSLLDWAKKKCPAILPALRKCFYELATKEYQLNTITVDTKKFDSKKRSILHWAILCHEPPETIDLLIWQGADINSKYRALSFAAEEGLVEIAKSLLTQHGAYINVRSPAGATPLMFAVENGQKAMLDFLLANGADLTIPLQSVTNYHKKFKLTKNDTPLHAAIKQGNKEFVEILVKNGADIHARVEGLDALRRTAEHGQVEIAKWLLTQPGIDINGRSGSGATSLIFAIEHGHKNMLDFLLANGADLTIPLQRSSAYHKKFKLTAGDTPLHAAIKQGNKEFVETLVKYGADIHALVDGHNALRLAAEQGQVEIAKWLLAQPGVDINARSPAGAPALIFAVEHGHKNMVDFLLANGADITIPLQTVPPYHNKFKLTAGDTPLHAAAKLGNEEIIQTLISKNASTLSLNRSNKKPSEVLKKDSAFASKLKLFEYAEITNQRNDNEYKKYNVLGFEFDLRFFGACSAKEKKDAVLALKRVAIDGENAACLKAHRKALDQGTLKDIRHALKIK